ncbi:hypothetical protein SAMN06297164_3596 [Nitrosomonas ureae]|uniref:Uncharacterized protein n=1 Tax=Nitrosomonas ureae TaxID=44577 RepID=A0A286ALS1_9PROT|nr:hypothetical protein SAMN06297164_3596 [Nitrosomonas ureae]
MIHVNKSHLSVSLKIGSHVHVRENFKRPIFLCCALQ